MYPEKLISSNEQLLLIDHFIRLGPDDRYMRFGYQIQDEQIKEYIEHSFGEVGHQWFGLFDDDKIIGTIHVALLDESQAEMGLSVDSKCRGSGLGQALFNRGLVWARARGTTKIYMQCLSENKIIQHIAKKNGMLVATIDHHEQEAKLVFPLVDYAAPFNDIALDRISAVDKIYKTQQTLYNNMFLLWTKGKLK